MDIFVCIIMETDHKQMRHNVENAGRFNNCNNIKSK